MGKRFGRKKKQQLRREGFKKGYEKGKIRAELKLIAEHEGRDYITMSYIPKYEALWHWAKEDLSDKDRDSFFNIIANGTKTIHESSGYHLKINEMNHTIDLLHKKVMKMNKANNGQ